MATLHIQEYSRLGADADGERIQAGSEPAVNSQTVTFSTSSQSTAFNKSTRLVRVVATSDAYLVFGDNPTATASGMKIAQDTAEYFGVKPGQKVAVYDGTS
jgi:hypothetical protein